MVANLDGRRRCTSNARLARGVIRERADVPVRAKLAAGVEPRRTPAEAGDPEPLEPLGERPQRCDLEWLLGAGDVLLAHVGAMLSDGPRPRRRPGSANVSRHRLPRRL